MFGWFSRTSCFPPDVSERPLHPQLHKPQFQTAHKADIGKPSVRIEGGLGGPGSPISL